LPVSRLRHARHVQLIWNGTATRSSGANKGFVLAMATGSIIGTILGGLLLGAVPEAVLIPLLAALDGTTTAQRGLRVAELAAAMGVGAATIRFYEKTGLLLAPARTPAGYRVYEASQLTGCDSSRVRNAWV
jgi:hypothetical protein